MVTNDAPAKADTQRAILDSATRIMIACGYHGFSYADIAQEVGVRKATIHYYYPGKHDLARSVVTRYRTEAREAMRQLRAFDPDPARQLARYLGFYGETDTPQPRMCLCAMLAGEMLTLPHEVGAEIRGYYADQTAWLSDTLTAGRDAGVITFDGSADDAAQTVLATLEGAMLSARTFDDVSRAQKIGASLLRLYGIDA